MTRHPFKLLLLILVLLAGGCGDDGDQGCEPGSANCACKAEGAACSADSLSCLQGFCRVCENGACVPLEPKCYSPCRGSFVDKQGKQRVCSEEGLVEGCLSGSRCALGTCVPDAEEEAGAAGAAAVPAPSAQAEPGLDSAGAPGQSDEPAPKPGVCSSDPECPEHQTCIAGRCYSTCDRDSECAAGSTCSRKVCRQLCSETQPCQGLGYSCQSLGNTQQVCRPTVTQDETLAKREPASDVGAFSLRDPACAGDGAVCRPRRLSFDSNRTSLSFVIRNDSPVSRVFTINKLRQSQLDADGSEQVFLASRGENPLPWLELGKKGSTVRAASIDIVIGANAQVEIELSQARNDAVPRWQAVLEVSTPGLGQQRALLDYSERVPGRWSGKAHYFGNFGDHTEGHDQLDDWIAERGNLDLAQQVPNAFIRAWANFRQGRLSRAELDAVVDSVLTGSWDYARVKELCAEAQGGVCAPFIGPANRPVISIVNDATTAPVPSGVVQLDLTLNLGEASLDPECAGDSKCFAGRIDSREALQYPNNPNIRLRFAANPSTCPATGPCLTSLVELSSQLDLGARFYPANDSACGSAIDFESKSVPWLVPGMLRNAAGLPSSERKECRDTALPYQADTKSNLELALANPVPDGMHRRRKLELVDGFMLEQQQLFIIFRETLESFLGGEHDVFSSYGFTVLRREPQLPQESELSGALPSEPSGTRSPQPLRTACSERLLHQLLPSEPYVSLSDVPSGRRGTLVDGLLTGRTLPLSQLVTIDQSQETPHYLCTWNEVAANVSNGAPTGQTVVKARIDGICPRYARVVYFTLAASQDTTPIGTCATTNSCVDQLTQWAELPGVVRLPASEASNPNFADAQAEFDLTWGCTDSTRALCDDYDDLTEGKSFFAPGQAQVVLNSLPTDIKEAFRYKFQFQNRDGQSVGFVPEICDASSKLVPYCYSPGVISDIGDRVDCLLSIYDEHVTGTSELADEDKAEELRKYLSQNFGFSQEPNPLGDPRVVDGFERLYAELMVMLGDDAYTAAFASRFDLAESRVLGFEGSKFEADGIDLSGVAGREMYKLYQAGQYYTLVLDRFFAQTPLLWRNLEVDEALRFLSSNTVAGYFTRVIRASTQLANTQSEIARRYQTFNRPDLARRVIERAYARSYLESQILSELMRSVQGVVDSEQQPQVAVAVAEAERRYRVAMLEMKEAYKRISEDRTVFGFAPDYIPFPALEEAEDGAFPVIVARAKERLAVADTDEQRALAGSAAFETDGAAFQGELVKIRADFDKQLGSLCGTFKDPAGNVYPAVARYKHLSDAFAKVADPCGLAAGALWSKGQDIGTMDLELRKANQEADNLGSQAAALVARVTAQCRIVSNTAQETKRIQEQIDELERVVDAMGLIVTEADRVINIAGQLANLTGEEFLAIPTYQKWAFSATAIATVAELGAIEVKEQIRDHELDQAQATAIAECEQYAADGAYEMKEIQREVLLKNLDLLLAEGNLGVAISDYVQLQNERVRLESQWEDSNQLTINVQAAKNDPNVRIYKNDAIINADRSFTSALREAYRATRVFEYYTGQSYAALDKLFLVRMVSAGDQNLKQYLAELEDAFFSFEEQFGKPATRVAVISLRDDVFKAPYYANSSVTQQLPLNARVRAFRQKLMSNELVDDEGNVVVPFQTDFNQLSPLTNEHKILFIEASIESADHGDDVGRLYVRQLGTSGIVNAAGQRHNYVFPPRTAVLNPLFPSQTSSGRDAFDTRLGGPTASIFRDYRFRDRPFVNSSWQLVFNPRTESVNRDIPLSAIDDIKLYIYYTDFSNL